MLIEVECADQPKYKGFGVCVCLGWAELVNQI